MTESTRSVLRPFRRLARRGLRAARALPDAFRHWRGETALRLAYRYSGEGRRSRARLAAMRDTQSGRCVIIGNGPSLNQMDLSVLRDVPTFALNRGYLLFDRIGAPSTYLVSANKYVLEQSMDEMLGSSPGPKFFNWRHRHLVPKGRSDVIYFDTVKPPGFSTDVPGRGLWEGATVTMVALQLAFHLGYREVVLIGVDHNFATEGPAHKLVTSQGADPNHFDPNYFGAGYRWQLPDLERSERAYRLAKAAYEAAGGEVVDATVGGKLQVFRKADFAELFRN